MKLYQEQIMDHYRNPANRRMLPNPDFNSTAHNRSCGDTVSLSGRIEGDTLIECGFQGSGCVISQAAASMLTQWIIGKSLDQMSRANAQDMIDLLGIAIGPTRLKCALLALDALKKGIEGYSACLTGPS